MAELGYISILAACFIAGFGAVASFWGGRTARQDLLISGRRAVVVSLLLVSLASGVLLFALMTNDFSIAYVANHSSRDMPAHFRFASWWGGQAGSLLFWAWVLAVMTGVVMVMERKRHPDLVPFILAVMLAILAYFLGILAFASNPFEKLPQPVADGMGLNPLLRTSDMFSHPLTVLLGYVTFTVPFAFAIAALITGRLDDWWLRSTRRWALAAWLFLSMGNLFGMLWAYEVLGWGGYWAWDPVENASLMPWLTGTAFLHSAMIQRRRGMLKVWNVILIITTFSLSIFGTMVTRSGIISSVHSFSEGSTGPLFLGLLVIVLVGSLGLLWSRLNLLQSEHRLDSVVSREASFLFNNVLMVGAAFAVLWGTVYPFVSEALRGVKAGVGAPYYSQVTGPIFLGVIVLMGFCPLIGWRKVSVTRFLRNLTYPLVAFVGTGVALAVLGVRPYYAVISFASVAFVMVAIGLEFWRGLKVRVKARRENYLVALPRLIWSNRPRYGGYIIHIGVALLALGVVGSQMFSTSAEATVAPGETVQVQEYALTFRGLRNEVGRSETRVIATFDVQRNGKALGTLESSKKFLPKWEEPVTEVGIRSTPQEDLYLILVGWSERGEASIKVLVNPLVWWIWLGGYIIVIGTVIAFWPETAPAYQPAVERRAGPVGRVVSG